MAAPATASDQPDTGTHHPASNCINASAGGAGGADGSGGGTAYGNDSNNRSRRAADDGRADGRLPGNASDLQSLLCGVIGRWSFDVAERKYSATFERIVAEYLFFDIQIRPNSGHPPQAGWTFLLGVFSNCFVISAYKAGYTGSKSVLQFLMSITST